MPRLRLLERLSSLDWRIRNDDFASCFDEVASAL